VNTQLVYIKPAVSALCAPSVTLSMSFKEIENSRGERGHPCFTLKDGWIVADLSPSNSIIQVFEDGQHVDGHLVLQR